MEGKTGTYITLGRGMKNGYRTVSQKPEVKRPL
jgi:hypothetical protein